MDKIYQKQGIHFVWNQNKAYTNRKKHGVSFEQACEAFFDPFYVLLKQVHQKNIVMR